MAASSASCAAVTATPQDLMPESSSMSAWLPPTGSAKLMVWKHTLYFSENSEAICNAPAPWFSWPSERMMTALRPEAPCRVGSRAFRPSPSGVGLLPRSVGTLAMDWHRRRTRHRAQEPLKLAGIGGGGEAALVSKLGNHGIHALENGFGKNDLPVLGAHVRIVHGTGPIDHE